MGVELAPHLPPPFGDTRRTPHGRRHTRRGTSAGTPQVGPQPTPFCVPLSVQSTATCASSQSQKNWTEKHTCHTASGMGVSLSGGTPRGGMRSSKQGGVVVLGAMTNAPHRDLSPVLPRQETSQVLCCNAGLRGGGQRSPRARGVTIMRSVTDRLSHAPAACQPAAGWRVTMPHSVWPTLRSISVQCQLLPQPDP